MKIVQKLHAKLEQNITTLIQMLTNAFANEVQTTAIFCVPPNCIALYQFLVHCAPKLPCEDESLWVIPSTLYHTQCLGWRVPCPEFEKIVYLGKFERRTLLILWCWTLHTSSEGKLDTRRWTETWDFLRIRPAASFSRFLSLVSPSLAVDTKINYARHTGIRSFTRPRI